MFNPLHEGIRNSFCDLDATAFTKSNQDTTGFTNMPNGVTSDTTLFPTGVLAGSVASMLGDGITGPATSTATANLAVGIYVNNARGGAFQPVNATVSNKVPHWEDGGLYETDLYETKTVAGVDLVYAVNDLLYCSRRGFITKDNDSAAVTRKIGYVEKAPDSKGVMQIKLQIMI